MRTAYGALLKAVRRGPPLGGKEAHQDAAVIGLGMSRTIVIDPVQAVAATQAVHDFAGLGALAHMVRAPFEWTLIDFGPGVRIFGGKTLVGMLFGPVEGATDDPNEGVMLSRDANGQDTAFFMGATSFDAPRGDPGDSWPELERLLATEVPADAPAEVLAKRDELEAALRRLIAEQGNLRETNARVVEQHARIDREPDVLQALAIPFACLAMLESANVELADSDQQYPKGHVGHGTPRLEVLIRQTRRAAHRESTGPARAFSHRFEVRGNFAHHFEETAAGTPNRLFEKWSLLRPEKVVQVDGKPCIRIWRPPYVKGPEDKPLVVKTRYLPKSQALKSSA